MKKLTGSSAAHAGDIVEATEIAPHEVEPDAEDDEERKTQQDDRPGDLSPTRLHEGDAGDSSGCSRGILRHHLDE